MCYYETVSRWLLTLLCFVVMPNFAQLVESAVIALTEGRADEVDYNDFVYAAQLVYDGVRDIRRAVLMNRVSI